MHKFLLFAIFSLMLGHDSFVFPTDIKKTSSRKEPFEKLTPIITEHAIELVQELSRLNEELQLVYLNLFALTADEAIEESIKCAEYIESQKALSKIHLKLGQDIFALFNLYSENIYKKISGKNISQKTKEQIGRKLEEKIMELMNHINTIYYRVLYSHLIKRNSGAIFYMFDKSGVIPKEKRNRHLPQPE